MRPGHPGTQGPVAHHHRHQRAATRLPWSPRVPATVSAAQAALTQADPPTMAPRLDGSRARAVTSPDGGGAPRGVRRAAAPPSGPAPGRPASAPAPCAGRQRGHAPGPYGLGRGRRRAADAVDRCARLPGDVSGPQSGPLHAMRGPAGAPRRRHPTGAGGRRDRRRTGVTARAPSGARRPPAWWPRGHPRTGRSPAPAAGAARGRHRPRAGGTRRSLPPGAPRASLVAVSQHARAAHGAREGDDGVRARVCGVGVAPAPCPQGPRGPLPEPHGPTGTAPPSPGGRARWCGEARAPHPRAVAAGAASHRGASAAAQTPWNT
jgi:hypothetical protein